MEQKRKGMGKVGFVWEIIQTATWYKWDNIARSGGGTMGRGGVVGGQWGGGVVEVGGF